MEMKKYNSDKRQAALDKVIFDQIDEQSQALIKAILLQDVAAVRAALAAGADPHLELEVVSSIEKLGKQPEILFIQRTDENKPVATFDEPKAAKPFFSFSDAADEELSTIDLIMNYRVPVSDAEKRHTSVPGLAAATGSRELVGVLLAHSSEYPAFVAVDILENAVRSHDPALVKQVYEAIPEFEFRGRALALAIFYGNFDIVKYLTEQGCVLSFECEDPEISTNYVRTRHFEYKYGLRVLRVSGEWLADPLDYFYMTENSRYDVIPSPASSEQRLAIVTYLFEQNALSKLDYPKILKKAIFHNDLATARYLRDKGVKLNVQIFTNKEWYDDRSNLMKLIRHDRIEMLTLIGELLKEAGETFHLVDAMITKSIPTMLTLLDYGNVEKMAKAAWVKAAIELDSVECLSRLTAAGGITEWTIDDYLELASAGRRMQCLAYLMDFKHREFGINAQSFEL